MDNFQNKLHNSISEIDKVADIVYNSEKVAHLDLDILMEKLRNAYDVILSFDTKDSQTTTQAPIIKEQQIQPKPQEVKSEPVVENPVLEPKPQIKEEIKPKEEVKPEVIINRVIEKPVIEKPIEPSIPKQEEKKVTPIEIPKIPEIKKETPAENVKTEKQQEIIKEIEEVKKELEETKAEEPVIEEPSVLQYLNKQVSKPKEEPVHKTIAETYQTQKSIFESMAQKEEKPDIASSFPTMDLRTSIGVNEKFMFINDLFSGNLREYTEFIQTLNGAKSLIEATAIVDNMKKEKHWVANSLSFTTLQDIVSKKFD